MSAVCSCCNAEKFQSTPLIQHISLLWLSQAVGVSNAAVKTHTHNILYNHTLTRLRSTMMHARASQAMSSFY